MINQVYFTNIINSQLEKILKSKSFRESRILKSFLQSIVKETIAGKGGGAVNAIHHWNNGL
jgi:hypothetical protein